MRSEVEGQGPHLMELAMAPAKSKDPRVSLPKEACRVTAIQDLYPGALKSTDTDRGHLYTYRVREEIQVNSIIKAWVDERTRRGVGRKRPPLDGRRPAL
ncbi:hypothetical protein Landi51_03136 [Colletotrichum acutatum]